MSASSSEFVTQMRAVEAEFHERLSACDEDDYLTQFTVADGANELSHCGPYGCAIYAIRDELRARFAFAIPSEFALQVCAEFAPLVEIGAGTGYWAYLLHKRGVDIIAYDAHPPSTGRGRYRFKREWWPVLHGRARKAKQHADRTLFLCWPPYNGLLASRALSLYEGQHVIYIGEGYGGCTGDDAFHEALARDWEEIRDVQIPQWDGLHDRLYVYWRKAR